LSERPWTVKAPLHPRFRDTDAMGHLNNAVYLTYLEVARQEYWRELTGDSNYGAVPFIFARVEMDFRSDAVVDERLELRIRCSFIGNKSFGFEYEIHEAETDRLVVSANSVQVFYDYAARKSIPCPPGLRERLEAFEGRPLSREVSA